MSEAENPPSLKKTVKEIIEELKSGALVDIDLRELDFTNEDLRQVNFGNADVTDALFRDADLREADLSGVKGLVAAQLTGADLTRCKLPEAIVKFPQLEQVKELSKNAGAMYLSTLVASAFLLLTTYSTRDIQLLTNQGTANLPILNIQVATGTFFSFAPLVMLGIFIILNLYLNRLWKMLGDLPAIFPDGITLTSKSYPWMLNELVAMGMPRLQRSLFLWATVLFAVCGIVPLVVFGVYVRCLVQHDMLLSSWHLFLFVLTLYWAIRSYLHLKFTLDRRPEDNYDAFRNEKEARKRHVGRWICATLFLIFVTAYLQREVNSSMIRLSDASHRQVKQWYGWFSNEPTLLFKFQGRIDKIKNLKDSTGQRIPLDYSTLESISQADKSLKLARSLHDKLKPIKSPELVRFITFNANIEDDRTAYPSQWQPSKDLFVPFSTKELNLLQNGERDLFLKSRQMVDQKTNKSPIDQMESAWEALRNSVRPQVYVQPRSKTKFEEVIEKPEYNSELQWLRASGAFLVNADFRGADLMGADFANADLRGATWIDESSIKPLQARLSFSVCEDANLANADFEGSKLIGVNFRYAELINANLSRANLIGADLASATLTEARLVQSSLTGADLSFADLSGADLFFATLTGADLHATTLVGANLRSANMTCADLRNTILAGANLRNATLIGTDISGTDFTAAKNLGSAFLDRAFYSVNSEPRWPKDWQSRYDRIFVGASIVRKRGQYKKISDQVIDALGENQKVTRLVWIEDKKQ